MRRTLARVGFRLSLACAFLSMRCLNWATLVGTNANRIEAQVKAASQEQTLEALLGDAMIMLSGLTRSAGVVVTTKENARLKAR